MINNGNETARVKGTGGETGDAFVFNVTNEVELFEFIEEIKLDDPKVGLFVLPFMWSAGKIGVF